MTNRDLMKQARNSLKGNWGNAVLIYFFNSIIVRAVGPFSLIIAGPLNLGLANFALNLSRGKKAEINQLFDGFKKFEKALVASLLIMLYVFLWTLLLIIPGIIAMISYSQTFYILADHDKMSGLEALKKSQQMMQGKKWKYFLLGLRFFGWFLLSLLTFGIGFLFLLPYMQISYAKFYEDINN